MAIKRSLPYKTKMLFKQIMGNECWICGEKTDHIEVDHIVPLWDGGADDIENLQILCYECHKLKSAIESRKWARLHPMTIITIDCDGNTINVREAKHGTR